MLRQLHQNYSITIDCNVPMLFLFSYIFCLHLTPESKEINCYLTDGQLFDRGYSGYPQRGACPVCHRQISAKRCETLNN